MQRKMMFLFTTLILFSLVIAPVSIAKAQVAIQASAPGCPPFDLALMRDKGFLQSLPPECAKAYQKLMQNGGDQAVKPDIKPLALGGPDAFGYTYDNTVPYSWIDASTGTDSLLVGDDVASLSPTPIGFNFPFYGIPQSQLYFNTNGLITFGLENVALVGGVTIPAINVPNNFIAPFWDDLFVGSPENTGAIYYLHNPPQCLGPCFVIEWKDVTKYGGSSTFSVEAILYENGDIVIQHQSLPASYKSTVGIENSLGSEGLQYQSGTSGLSFPKAIRLYYPTADTARVLVSPLKAGKLSAIGGNTDFTIKIYNTGNRSADTFDLTTASTWPVTLYKADGITLLTDTNSNGKVDTDTILQGGSTTIIARFSTPGSVTIGDGNDATITVNSALDISKTKTTSLSMAVPANFANVFQDATDGAMSFMIATNISGGSTYKATPDNYVGYHVAVAKLESGNYIYTWDVGVPIGNIWMHDIEYALLGHDGSLVLPVTKLTNNSSAPLITQDISPSVAIAPNGTIGLVWYRYLYDISISKFNYNIYFATLNSTGSVLSAPTNVTNNNVWSASSDLNIPTFLNPTIAASDDNLFILSWQDDRNMGASWQDNIWYTVRNTAGANVMAPAALTSDNTSDWPIINNLSAGKFIMTWNSNGVPTYAVLNSSGVVSKAATSLGVSNLSATPDAVLLPNGKVAIAWPTNTGVQFAILNSSYIMESGPATASSPSLAQGYALSVTTDSSSRVILTWGDGTTYQNLFYALGDSTGTFITAPMSYRQSYAGSYTSYNGQGNAPYLPPGVDGAASFNASLFTGPPAGNAGVGIHYTNYGATTATGVVLTVTLGQLIYVSDTSGVTPTVNGSNQVIWNLPDMSSLGGQNFTLYVTFPSGATLGTHYPISLSLASNEPDINQGDNTGNAQVMAGLRVFLPLVFR